MPTVLKTVDRWQTDGVTDTVTIQFKDGTSTTMTAAEFDRRTQEGDTFRLDVADIPVTNALPPHLQRMVEEKIRVDADGAKLAAFIESNPLFSALPEPERVDMYGQLAAMQQHAFYLGRRLARAGV